jgi:BMFP domain-containing protein YqiC
MNEQEISAMVREFAPIIREYVDSVTAPLIARIAELEARPAPEKGEKGDAGESVTAEQIASLVSTEVTKALEAPAYVMSLASLAAKDAASFIPTHKDAIEPLLARIAELEAREPIHGEKGECGSQGPQGEKGEAGQSVTPEDLSPLIKSAVVSTLQDEQDGFLGKLLDQAQATISEHVETAVARIPIPKDGATGDRGERGSSFTCGDGLPEFDGTDGDAYLDLKTGNVYAFKSSQSPQPSTSL